MKFEHTICPPGVKELIYSPRRVGFDYNVLFYKECNNLQTDCLTDSVQTQIVTSDFSAPVVCKRVHQSNGNNNTKRPNVLRYIV